MKPRYEAAWQVYKQLALKYSPDVNAILEPKAKRFNQIFQERLQTKIEPTGGKVAK